jgi:Photosynthesis system II assembly factor YCF48
MPQDDRDRNFEKALSRHLRAACPEAETLAAYHERELAPDEMIVWKKHITGCAACQEILAQLEASEHVTLEREHEREMVTQAYQAEALRLASRAASTGPRVAQAEAAAGRLVKEMPKRSTRWRWAAPAGAVAAGLLVWVTLREMNHPAFVPQRPAQIAVERAPAVPPLSAKENQQAKIRASETAAAKELNAPAREAKPQLEDRKNGNEVAKVESLPRSSNQKLINGRSIAGLSEEMQIASSAEKAVPKTEAQRSEAPGIFANAPAPPSSAQQMDLSKAAPAAAAPSPAVPQRQQCMRDEKKSEVAGGAISQPANAELTSNYKQSDVLQEVEIAAPRLVSSPNAKSIWRVGDQGRISLSRDHGSHWQTQASGVTAALTSGSAPSDEICWVAGQNGTILRTVDGGKHWAKISSPVTSGVGKVQASDAFHAKISSADRQLSYETSDGGATWRQVPNE